MTSMDSRRSSVSMLCTVLGPFSRRYSTSAMLLSMMCPSAHLHRDMALMAFYIQFTDDALHIQMVSSQNVRQGCRGARVLQAVTCSKHPVSI